jgi:hypothetical protein
VNAITTPAAATPADSHMPLDRAWMKALCAASAAAGGRPAASDAVPSPSTRPSCCAALTPVPARASEMSFRAMCWNRAPRAATPNVPPTIRLIERIPDPTPAFWASTAFIAAVDMGDITSAIPIPMMMKAGRRRP